jgi:hypothetical protein
MKFLLVLSRKKGDRPRPKGTKFRPRKQPTPISQELIPEGVLGEAGLEIALAVRPDEFKVLNEFHRRLKRKARKLARSRGIRD